jgi:hypothetical protein
MTARTDLFRAIEAANREALAELAAETGLAPLASPTLDTFDHTGPVLLAHTATVGPIRIRVLAVDQAGRHYADAGLIAESLHPDDRNAQQYLCEMLANDSHEILIVSLMRGEWSAYLVDLDTLTRVCGLPDLVELPADFTPWGRSWDSFPWLNDRDAETLDDHGIPV